VIDVEEVHTAPTVELATQVLIETVVEGVTPPGTLSGVPTPLNESGTPVVLTAKLVSATPITKAP
jgi:hypothetical protein